MDSQSMGRTVRTVNGRPTPIVDEEFKALLPALTPDQREGLERSLLADGVLSPLAVWEEEGILLDGHNRLEIATRQEIPFATRTVKLASREAAVEWIFAHQRDRRNLTPDQLALVMGRHKNKVKKAPGGAHPKSLLQKEGVADGETDERLAREYGVSPVTIFRAGKFAAAVETLKAVDPDIEAKVVTGKGPTRKAVIAAAEAEPEEAKAILAGDVKVDPRKRYPSEPKETLADRRGFKNLPRRPEAERMHSALGSIETILESIEEISPERANGERSSFAERLCKAARTLARISKKWKGETE